MFKLDNNFLIELGLGALPADEKNKMLAHIYETLEMRVGMKLAEQMTDAQLDEFESYINRNDEAGALTWLETNFPNYKQVVADELEKLKNEIKAVAPSIVAQSMNNANAASAAPQQMNAPQAPAAGQYAQPAPAPQPMQQPYQPAPQPQYGQPQMPQQPYAPQPGMGAPMQPQQQPMQQPYQPPMQQPGQQQPYQYPQPPVPPTQQ